MSTYVISDIHGCYNQFQTMLEKINLSAKDQLILGGDYIDRGPDSVKMLRWLENRPANVICIKGNHDVEFASYVALMKRVMKEQALTIDKSRPDATALLCELTSGVMAEKGFPYFDWYHTIQKMTANEGVGMEQLERWAEMLTDLPYTYEMTIGGRRCIVVHAGYIEDLTGVCTDQNYADIEDFYLSARDDAYLLGGISHGMIIAGHTPTVLEEELPYNDGDVYRFYDEEMDCIFYDIDCGCAYRSVYKNAKLACLRLEDETVVYV
ncbi:MAG: metallophosphoesterase [Eubacterium sp.]|nr:metallophosphoesterase [Eubacterium sp.]